MSAFLSKTAIAIPVLAMFAIMETIIQKPELFWWLFIILIAVVILSSLYLSGFWQTKKLKKLSYLILPTLYTLASLSLFVLAQKSLTQHIFLFGISIVLAIVLNNISVLSHYHAESKKQVILKSEQDKRRRIILTVNQALILLTAFFALSSLFGIIYLLSFAIWQTLIVAVVIIFLLAWQFLSEIFPPRRALVYANVISLGLAQIFWSLSFWPTNYIANSIVLMASFYIILGILEHYSREALTRKLIKVYFSIAVIVITSVLATAQWKPQ